MNHTGELEVALIFLKKARSHAAGSPRALAKIRAAIKSVQGAIRHAKGKEIAR